MNARPLVNHGYKNSTLPATGQTTSYFTGDDGANTPGRSRTITLLTTGQYAGTTTITVNGKNDTHTNNCAFDHDTGLMWSSGASATVGVANDGKLTITDAGSGETLPAYVAAANAAALAGHTDWRCPNHIELYSVIDMEAAAASTPAGIPDSFAVWTSVTLPSGTTQALRIANNAGTCLAQDKTSTNFVWLVRGG